MLSVIIPAYNEAEMIAKTAATITRILKEAKIPNELIFIDDGSSDQTWNKIEDASSQFNEVRGISFSRNFGKESAIVAGLCEAVGDCCVVIDCDLQHPPEIIPQMYRMWEQGVQVVNGVKASRGKEGVLHKVFAKLFYRILSAAIKTDTQNASDYKLLDRKVVEALLAMPERNYFFRALSEWVGFETASIEYEVAERTEGESKWSPWSLVRYAITNITSFSAIPLHIVTILGFVVLAIAVVMGVVALVQYLCGIAVAGFTTVILLLLIIGSVIMISLGTIGYYISKIYEEVKARPKYLVAKRTER